ncbi:hypothetical protein TTHERM_001676219, partial (macronuclear) [Tetrahymena thermophila SB210]
GTQYLSQSLEKLSDLINLNLIICWNNIGPIGAQNISFCLQKCLKLSNLYLNMSGCDVQFEGVKQIVDSLEKCQKLTTLDLRFSYNYYMDYQLDQIKIKRLDKRILKMKRLVTKYFTYDDE